METALAHYRRVRHRVLAMLDHPQMRAHAPSRYWQEELDGIEYMLDASSAIVEKLRHHCHHLTGLRAYEYRKHHSHAALAFRTKLEALRKIDDRDLFVPESPVLGGFGHDIDGALVNLDTLKFYESMIALDRARLLPRSAQKRWYVMEIGAGWGGFAYQTKRLFPNTTYVVVDLPPAILFSATYLMTAFPDARVWIEGEDDADALQERFDKIDFIFVPHYALESTPVPSIDLGINMVSFQEMTGNQVASYFDRLQQIGCANFYSHNRDRSPHNAELSSVSDILSRYYALTTINVLPVQYTELTLPPKWSEMIPRTANPRSLMREAVKIFGALSRTMRRDPLPYRHIVGANRSGGPADAPGPRE